MTRQFAIIFACGMVATSLLAQSPTPGVLRIGITKSLLPGDEYEKFDVMAANYKDVLMERAGLKGDPQLVESADELRKQLADGSVQLGGFQGFEFAWLKKKHPELEPLLVAMPTTDSLTIVLVVGKDSPAKSFVDVKGLKFAIAKDAREDTRQFLTQRCQENKTNIKDMFGEPLAPESAEATLDSVVDGVAKAAAVDRGTWKMFERRKPGRAAKLRVIDTSEPFVPSVVAYMRGKLDPTIAQRFRDGMSTCHTTPKGSHLVSQIKIIKFEMIPVDFDKRLAESLKAYPMPK